MAQALAQGFTIGRLSDLTGVKVETIRYYEKVGLLSDPGRTAGGHRVYGAEQARRLTFIRRCRELGFSLNDIRNLLGLEDDAPTCDEVHEMTLRHKEAIKAKIRDLKHLSRRLEEIAAQCREGGDTHCPIIDSLSHIGPFAPE
jgi:MerR family transcriptional regulator, mercuric resistance operon regulatory protein